MVLVAVSDGRKIEGREFERYVIEASVGTGIEEFIDFESDNFKNSSGEVLFMSKKLKLFGKRKKVFNRPVLQLVESSWAEFVWYFTNNLTKVMVFVKSFESFLENLQKAFKFDCDFMLSGLRNKAKYILKLNDFITGEYPAAKFNLGYLSFYFPEYNNYRITYKDLVTKDTFRESGYLLISCDMAKLKSIIVDRSLMEQVNGSLMRSLYKDTTNGELWFLSPGYAIRKEAANDLEYIVDNLKKLGHTRDFASSVYVYYQSVNGKQYACYKIDDLFFTTLNSQGIFLFEKSERELFEIMCRYINGKNN